MMIPSRRLTGVLSLLLVTTIAGTVSVEAKVLVGHNRQNEETSYSLFSSTTAAALRRRYLEEKKEDGELTVEEEKEAGASIKEILKDDFENNSDSSSSNNDSDNNNSSSNNDSDDNNSSTSSSNNETKEGDDQKYVPYPHGTAVRFQDQDGTWMSGSIINYNSDRKVYTIVWEEDDTEEEFSNLEKVGKMVDNGKKNEDDANNKEDDKNKHVDDVVTKDNNGDDAPAEATKETTKETHKEKHSSKHKSSSVYQGKVPENFEKGYIYNYDKLGEYEAWPVGTPTLLEFQDGYYEGTITSFELSDDKKNATYGVSWSDGTADIFVNELEWMDLMVQNAKEYEPWEIGTETYGYIDPLAAEDDKAYLVGEITSFKNGTYTVTWSNGDVVGYSNFEMVDWLVNNVWVYYGPHWKKDNYEPWPNGTPVSWDFDDGWWEGTITGFHEGTYQVTWSDSTKKTYNNLEKIDQMVQFAMPEPPPLEEQPIWNDYEYYPIGTIVYAEFEDGWWVGFIDSYDGDYYVIQWSDSSTDNFLAGPEINEMVANSQYIPYDQSGIYPLGTEVYSKFEDGWYWGSVEYNAGGLYQILWEDGTRTGVDSRGQMNHFVKNATKAMNANSMKGLSSTVGKIFLSLFVLLACFCVIVFFVRRSKNKKKLRAADVTEQVKQSELNVASESNKEGYSDEGNKEGYSDEGKEENSDDVEDYTNQPTEKEIV